MTTEKRAAETDIYGYHLRVTGDLLVFQDTQNGGETFHLGSDVMNHDALKERIRQAICRDAGYAAQALIDNLADDAELFDEDGYVIPAASLAGHAEAATEVKP